LELNLPPGVNAPARVAVFYLRLPVPIRLSGGPYVSLVGATDDSEGSPPWVLIELRQLEADPPPAWPPGFLGELDTLLGAVPSALAPPKASRQEIHVHTWAVCTAPVAPDGNVEPSPYFDACLAQLNRIVRAYVMVTKETGVRPVTKEDLPFVLIWELRWGDNFDTSDASLMVLHMNLPLPSPPLPPDDEIQVLIAANNANPSLDHPFVVQREWLDRARYARFQEGDREGAVIFLQTAAESLLRGVFSMALVDRGSDSPQIRAAEDAMESFKTLLQRGIPSELGGDWSLTGEGKVATYWTNLYRLRNRIVHGARYVSGTDAEAALASFSGLVEYINELLLRQPRRFPRTLLALLGEPGLRRRHAWTKEFADAAAAVVGEPNPYWRPIDLR
jgi:hypothetical protein